MKRVFIVHQWYGSPQTDWYSWLKSELESNGFQVYVPEMPNTDKPEINAWVSHLSNEVGKADNNTLFVGHSIGCQTIIRYLGTQKQACGGAVFVAGWFQLTGLETEEEKAIAKPWIETEIDFEKVKENLPRSIAIFSDNDPYVPMINMKLFQEKIGSEIIIEGHKGHFTGGEGVVNIDVAKKSLIEMASSI